LLINIISPSTGHFSPFNCTIIFGKYPPLLSKLPFAFMGVFTRILDTILFTKKGGWITTTAVLGLLAGHSAQAQAPAWQLALALNGDPSYVSSIASDTNGNVYIAGSFSGTLNVGYTTLTSRGGSDIFVAKWNTASANFVWAQTAGGTSDDGPSSLAVNGTNIYLTGSFGSANADFGGTTLRNAGVGSSDVFVAKITDTGITSSFSWAQRAGGNSDDTAVSVAVSGSNVFIAGDFRSSSATYGLTTLTNYGGGFYDGFVAKIEDAGSSSRFVWAKQIGGTNTDELAAIAVTGSNIYVTGSFGGSPLAFGNAILPTPGLMDVFIGKMIDTGADCSFSWIQQAGGSGFDYARALAVNGANVYVTGEFSGSTASFGSTTLSNANTAASATAGYFNGDVFVAKLTDAGATANFNWAQRAGGSADDRATAVVVDGPKVYLAGYVSSASAGFGSTTLLNAGVDNSDLFVAKLTDAGASASFNWAQHAGGSNYDIATSLTLLGADVYTTGYIVPAATFGNQLLSSPTGTRVAYLASLRDAVPSLASVTPAIGTPGDLISLTGTNLTGASSITFTGTGSTTVTSGYTVSRDGTQITGVPVPDGARTGPISVTTASGTATSSQAFVVVATWTGAVSSDWTTPGNWRGGLVPTQNERAAIGVAPRMPVVSGNQAVSILGLFIDASLTIADNSSLSLYGAVPEGDGQAGLALVVTGATNVIRAQPTGLRNGVLRFVGANRQKIDARGGSQYHFDNVYVGPAGIQLYRISAHLHGILTLDGDVETSNSYAVNREPLVLLSDSASTAMVVNNSGQVLGPVTVQRYLDRTQNAGLGYRHLASPVTNTTTEDLTTSSFSPAVNPAYNASATPNLVSPFPTVFSYDETRQGSSPATTYSAFDKGWVSPGTLADALVSGKGYTVNLAGGQTVDFVGTLGNGDVPLSLTRGNGPEAGWNLIGNPYPATLDWTKVRKPQGLDDAIYVYQSTSQYAGAYRTYVNGIGNPTLALGQGFFVRISEGTSSAQLTLTNSARTTDASSNAVLQGSSVELRPRLQLALQTPTGLLRDATYIYFEEGATPEVDAHYDAVKLPNPNGLNVATTTSGRSLAINGLPLLNTAPVLVPLQVTVPQAGTYALQVGELLNFAAGTSLYLRDNELGTSTLLAENTRYTFTLSSAVAPGRFALEFRPNQVMATAPQALTQQVQLYPNPARGRFELQLPTGTRITSLTLLNALGQVVHTQAGQGDHATIEVPGLATGVYQLRIQTAATTLTHRVVLN
jgi:hypothetical protein